MSQGFGQAKFAFCGSILGSSQFTILPQLALKTMLSLKVVKIDTKLSNSKSKSLTHSVECSAKLFLKLYYDTTRLSYLSTWL